MLRNVLLLVAFATIPAISETYVREIPGIISNEVDALKSLSSTSKQLTEAITQAKKISDVSTSNEIFCQTCDLVTTQIISYRKSGASKDSMVEFLRRLCDVFTDWGSAACQGYIDIEIDTILYIIDNKQDLTSSRFCAINLQPYACTDPNAVPWSIIIPPKNHTTPQLPSNASSTLKILHLTDIHYDPLYEPGSNSDCGLQLCCQKASGPPATNATAAGFWGDYGSCDMPWHAITNFTAHLKSTNESYDFVYYTGDIISHTWATSRDNNTKSIQQLFQHFSDTFNRSKTPVYAILGNHEPHPGDFYSPLSLANNTNLSTQFIFEVAAKEWSRWLPKTVNETILKGGYYTVLVRTGFRVVALNSNVCFLNNLWLIYEDEDPYDQLKWLVQVLADAEKNNEKVHILSHIPPGYNRCQQTWGSQFRKIVERFATTIVGQFNGHTHLDELRLFRDPVTHKVINAAYNGGSFTTYVGFNPNYRVYTVDNATLQVVDYDQYTYNLTQANQNATTPPQWYKLYSFKQAYGLNDTSYASFDDLTVRLSKNRTLIQQYFRYQGRESRPFLAQGCDDKCLKRLLCGITAVEPNEATRCQQLN